MIKHILLVAVGGAVGAVARYCCTLWLPKSDSVGSVFWVNAVGCMLIGLIMGAITKTSMQAQWQMSLKLLLVTGFCGGFTTFSTFTYEGLQFLHEQRYFSFLWFSFASLITGFLATAVGIYASKFL
ncbi:MAG TPA: fluoride efflux transporter CrcB [Chitinophagaceae bacterium]|nr:fluoride efflux transporter CrcB [Chitinophagaceae bacterium]HAN40060.1 fluoride efflux transporter CrcB [Chitinophagaceae bacterium]